MQGFSDYFRLSLVVFLILLVLSSVVVWLFMTQGPGSGRVVSAQVDCAFPADGPDVPPDPPKVRISGLEVCIQDGGSDSFTVTAYELIAPEVYTITVWTDESTLGFNSNCSVKEKSYTPGYGETSRDVEPALYACGWPGGGLVYAKVQGRLPEYRAQVNQRVYVTEKPTPPDYPDPTATPTPTPRPPRVLPKVSLHHVNSSDTEIDEGEEAKFIIVVSPPQPSSLYVTVKITDQLPSRYSYLDPGEPESKRIHIRPTSTSVEFSFKTKHDGIEEENGAIEVRLVGDTSQYQVDTRDFLRYLNIKDIDDPDPPTGLRVSGDMNNRGEITSRWNTVQGAVSYDLQYIEEICDSETGECKLGREWTEKSSFAARRSLTQEATFDGPDENKLYRVQARSTVFGDSDWSEDDFALTYPTGSPVLSANVATAPLHGYLKKNANGSHEFRYVICTETLSGISQPSRNQVSIAGDIEDAVEKWESTVIWDRGRGNIISATRHSLVPGEKCTHPLVTIPVVPGVNSFAEIPYEPGRFEIKVVSDERIEAACNADNDAVPAIPGCWRSRSWEWPTIDEIEAGAILINESLGAGHWNSLVTGLPGGCTELHELVIHEAGHAYGIGARVGLNFNGHPVNKEHSVMSYKDHDDDCKPQAYDIVALMAIYQSR